MFGDTMQKRIKFDIGTVHMSNRLREQENHSGKISQASLDAWARYCQLDWGDISEEEKLQNDENLKKRGEINACYKLFNGDAILVCTLPGHCQTHIWLKSQGSLTEYPSNDIPYEDIM